MKHLYRILELAGPDHTDTVAAEVAHEAALDWANSTSPLQMVRWYGDYQIEHDYDPEDIFCPIDGQLRSDWHETVIDIRAAAILRGDV